MAWDSPYKVRQARLLKEKRAFPTTATPSNPQLYGVPHAIASYASGMGGVIAGGTALKFYSPNYRTSDVDIITNSNRHMFAQMLVNRLNSQYGNRFRVLPGHRAVRIFDVSQRKYVADIVNYPLPEENVLKFENFNIVSPEHVFAGKMKNIMEKESYIKQKIHKFSGIPKKSLKF